MAKTTRETPPKGARDNVAVMEPTTPIPPEPEQPEEKEDPETVFQETAGQQQIDSRRGRGHFKEAAAGFFARLSEYPKDDWEKLLLYIYRMAPITDRRASGEPVNYIAKLSEPIDEDYVLREPNWGGSGKYRVRLNKLLPDGKNTPIDVVEFVVENKKYPPQVPPGEWVDDPRNKRWAWAKTYYDGKNEAANQPPAPPPTQGPSLGEIVTAVKTMSEMTRANQPPAVAKEESPFEKIDIVGLIEKTHSANDPVKMLSGFKDLADILKPAAPTVDPVTVALRIVEALKPAAAAAPLDPIAQLNQYATMAKTMKEAFGPGEVETEAIKQSRMTGTQEFIAELTRAFAPGVNEMFKVLGGFASIRMAQAQKPPANATPRATGPAAVAQPGQPQPVAPPAATAAEPVVEQQPEGQEEPPQMNRQQAEAHMIMTGLASVAPTLIRYFESEELTGHDFAAWFCDASLPTGLPNMPMVPELVDGIDALPMLKTYGAEQIRSLVKINAAPLYARIAPTEEKESALLKFLEEFLTYDPEALDEEKK